MSQKLLVTLDKNERVQHFSLENVIGFLIMVIVPRLAFQILNYLPAFQVTLRSF